MRKSLLLAGLVMVCTSGIAQWNGSANNSIVSSSPTTAKTGNLAVSDGEGGMLLAWIDSRTSTNQSIYIQRILSNGTTAFTNEVLVTDATGAFSSSKSNLVMSADGDGGAVLAWLDQRNQPSSTTVNDVYGQRIDGDGNALWTAGGVRLTVADNSVSSKTIPNLEIVDASNAIIVFGDNRNGTVDYFAQKIGLSNGATVWAGDVAVFGSQPGTQTASSILPDGSGGLFIAWTDPRDATNNLQIYSQRIDGSGNLLWGSDGNLVCDAANNQSTPQIISDGSNGIVIVWADNRSSSADGDIRAQRLDGNGVAQWVTNGIPVCIQVGTNQSNPLIVPGGGGYIIAWSDPRLGGGDRNIYANSIDNNGNTIWTTDSTGGVPIVTAPGNQPVSVSASSITMNLLSDGANGAIVVFDDNRDAGTLQSQIYAQRIDNNGAVVSGWAADGNPVSISAGAQSGPVAVADEAGNIIIAWRDARNGTVNGELFASKIQLSGVLPVEFTSVAASPKSSAVQVSWQTGSEQNTGSFVIERSSNGADFSAIGSVKAVGSGDNAYIFDDLAPLSGNSFYRIKSVDLDGKVKFSGMVRVSFSGLAALSVKLYPNPSTSTMLLQLNNLTLGNYNLRIVDMKGVTQQQFSVMVDAIQWQRNLNIGTLSAGSYMLQVVDKKGAAVITRKIVKQ